MPVSTADFYAYAQATGTPVPQNKKEQAALVPAIRQWRKSQLKQQRQENAPDLGDAVAWTGLSAGALAGLFLRKPANVRKVQDFVAKQKTSVQNFRRDVAQQLDPDAPAPSGRNTSATTNLQEVQQTGADAKEDIQTLLNRVKKPNALENLQAQGIPEFEATARIEAYATTGNQNFLEPSFNANTIPSGLEGFRSALGVKNIQVNEKNQIIGGELMNPTGEVPRSLREYAKQTSDDVYDAGIRELESEGAPEAGYSVTRSMPVSGAGISQADPEAYTKAGRRGQKPQQVLGEQYRIANEEFAREWDSLAQQGYVEPRTINRIVEPTELDLVVRNELKNDAGVVVEPAITYGEKLLKEDPGSYALLSQGTPVRLDAPYQLNKAKDLELVKQNAFTPEGEIINPQLINEWKSKYEPSAERLQGLHNQVFGDITVDDALVTSELSLSNKLLDPLQGDVITPVSGAGSQKGQQVGGMVTPHVSQPIYKLAYQKGIDNRQKVVAIGDRGPYEISNIKNLQGIEVVGKTADNFDEIVSQPMELYSELKNYKPIGEISKGPVVWATPEIVQAPLQVQKYSPTGEFLEEVTGKINRSEILGTLEQIKRQGIKENSAAEMVRSQVPKGGLPKQELSNLIAQTSKQTGVNPNLIVERLKTGGAADTSPIGLAKSLQNRLFAEKQIRLPVLDSRQSHNFIDSIMGYPRDQMGQRKAVIRNKLNQLEPLSNSQSFKNQKFLKRLGLEDYDPKTNTRTYTAKVFDPKLSRVPKGAPTLNIVDSPKKATSSYDVNYERVGWGDNDVVKVYDNANDFLSNYQGNTQLGQASINPPGLQKNIKIDKTGLSGEMRKIRSQLGRMSNPSRPPRFTDGPTFPIKQQLTNPQKLRNLAEPSEQWRKTGNYPAVDESTRLSIEQDLSPVSTNDLSESLFAQASDLSMKEQDRYNRRQRKGRGK